MHRVYVFYPPLAGNIEVESVIDTYDAGNKKSVVDFVWASVVIPPYTAS